MYYFAAENEHNAKDDLIWSSKWRECFTLNFLSWTLNLAKHATPFAPSPSQRLQNYYEVVRHRHGLLNFLCWLDSF